jgi:hypothetical protein
MDSYMKKAEHYHAPSTQVATMFGINPSASDRGGSGPIQVSFNKYVSTLSQLWLSALQSLEISKNDYPLAGSNIGVSQQPSDINPANTTRSYSAAAYLFPNSARENLAVLPGALVEKSTGLPIRAEAKLSLPASLSLLVVQSILLEPGRKS